MDEPTDIEFTNKRIDKVWEKINTFQRNDTELTEHIEAIRTDLQTELDVARTNLNERLDALDNSLEAKSAVLDLRILELEEKENKSFFQRLKGWW